MAKVDFKSLKEKVGVDDIAGKNLASPRSMLYAMFMAADICKHRQTYEEITSNPLQIKVFETKNAPDRSYLPE